MVSYEKCDPKNGSKVREQLQMKKPWFNQICENALQRGKQVSEI